MGRNSKYSYEFKKNLYEKYMAGEDKASLCKAYGISTSTFDGLICQLLEKERFCVNNGALTNSEHIKQEEVLKLRKDVNQLKEIIEKLTVKNGTVKEEVKQLELSYKKLKKEYDSIKKRHDWLSENYINNIIACAKNNYED